MKIVDYAGPSSADDAQWLDVWKAIINQDTAQVVSASWDECEAESQTDSSLLSSENTLFEQAAVQGQTVVASSGDHGSTGCYGDTDLSAATQSSLSVDDPASQPYVTSVGGTTMSGLSSNPVPSVWNSDGDASGGGVSSAWPLPSYQNNPAVTGAPGYSANCAAAAATGCREVPDVSALADFNEGYVILGHGSDGADYPAGEYWNIVAGTSGAAPVWAAVFAIADATTTCRLNGNVGFANPSLYTAGEGSTASSAFTDVTSGNNFVADDGGPGGYSAAVGYDLATGWGTPKVAGIMASTCQAPIVNPASYFVPDGPMRLMDTVPGANHVGPVTGPVGAYGTITLPVAGAEGDNVPADATAAVLNVIAVNPSTGGNATVYPDGGRSAVSNINWSANTTIPNLVVVPMTDGKVDLYNYSAGTVNFVADLEGYFTTDSTVAGASSYTPVTPVRVADTRSNHLVGNVVGPLGAYSTTAIQIAGQQGLPSSGMASVVMNVTVAQPTGGGAASVYAAGPNRPNSSNINFVKNETIPNLVIVPLSSSGQIDIYNYSGGTIQYVVDVQGYFSSGTAGDKYHALGPVRLLDTRIGTGQTSVSPIASDKAITMPLPSNYAAIIANLTVTAPQAGGALEAYPTGPTMPPVSNVNFGANETIANLAFVSSNSGVSLYNASGGTAAALLDLAGYFSTN